MFAEVQLLLNLDQFCKEHPHSHAGMYCDRSSLVLHTTCVMLVDYVTGIVLPPNVILEWDSMTDTLHTISQQVHCALLHMYLYLVMIINVLINSVII